MPKSKQKGRAGRQGGAKHRPIPGETPERTHDSDAMRARMRAKLRVKQLQVAVQREEERLREFRAGPPPGKCTEPWTKLKGAARPWWVVDALERGEDPYQLPDTRPCVNLFEMHMGRFMAEPETQECCRLVVQLGFALQDMGLHRKAARTFETALQYDKDDALCARHGLVSCLIDEGELAQVRTALDRFPDDRSTAFAMARALLEYIAWQVLREEDASASRAEAALRAAMEANPFAAVCVAVQSVIIDAVPAEVVVEVKECLAGADPPAGSIFEAVLYAQRELAAWSDAEGSDAWVYRQLQAWEVDLETLAELEEQQACAEVATGAAPAAGSDAPPTATEGGAETGSSDATRQAAQAAADVRRLRRRLAGLLHSALEDVGARFQGSGAERAKRASVEVAGGAGNGKRAAAAEAAGSAHKRARRHHG